MLHSVYGWYSVLYNELEQQHRKKKKQKTKEEWMKMYAQNGQTSARAMIDLHERYET